MAYLSGYLALTRMPENLSALRSAGAGFEPWYRFFPWRKTGAMDGPRSSTT